MNRAFKITTITVGVIALLAASVIGAHIYLERAQLMARNPERIGRAIGMKLPEYQIVSKDVEHLDGNSCTVRYRYTIEFADSVAVQIMEYRMRANATEGGHWILSSNSLSYQSLGMDASEGDEQRLLNGRDLSVVFRHEIGSMRATMEYTLFNAFFMNEEDYTCTVFDDTDGPHLDVILFSNGLHDKICYYTERALDNMIQPSQINIAWYFPENALDSIPNYGYVTIADSLAQHVQDGWYRDSVDCKRLVLSSLYLVKGSAAKENNVTVYADYDNGYSIVDTYEYHRYSDFVEEDYRRACLREVGHLYGLGECDGDCIMNGEACDNEYCPDCETRLCDAGIHIRLMERRKSDYSVWEIIKWKLKR